MDEASDSGKVAGAAGGRSGQVERIRKAAGLRVLEAEEAEHAEPLARNRAADVVMLRGGGLGAEQAKARSRPASQGQPLSAGTDSESVGAGPEQPAVRFTPGQVLALTELERLAIEHALAVTEGCAAEAARLLDIGEATIHRKIRTYRIDRRSHER